MLKAHKEQFKHLHVGFIPESKAYPEWSHRFNGRKFLAVVRRKATEVKQMFPEVYKELLEIGFVPSDDEYSDDLLVEAMHRFCEIYPSEKISSGYVVLFGDVRWDKKFWGIPLGGLVANMRNRNAYRPQLRNRLALIIDMSPREPGMKRYQGEDVVDAFSIFKQKNGHLNIADDYVIPEHDVLYPLAMRGAKLKGILNGIRYCGNYTKFHYDFEDLGITLNFKKRNKNWESIKEAIDCFKKLHPGTKILRHHAIEENDERYPERLRGMKLGEIVHSIRRGGTYAWDIKIKREILERGITYKHPELAISKEEFMKAAAWYRKVNKDETTIPEDFVVPKTSDYPKRLHGLAIGWKYKKIENGRKMFRRVRTELKALGFKFELV